MPVLTVRDGARSVVREITRPTPLDTLCPTTPPVPYDAGWHVQPDGAAVVLVSPAGTRHGTLAPGDEISIGSVTLQNPSGKPSTERLMPDSRPRLALVLPTGARVALGIRTISIGRAPRCDVVLDDASVSELHCKISPRREGWEIRDGGSTNGTRVAGVRIESALLSAGVALTLGRSRILCVGVPEDDAPATNEGEITSSLIGSSIEMERVRQAIVRYGAESHNVLIEGETGSGKEIVAGLLHRHSPRARGPFVAINAAAISPELVESELFGHERGAFTGAATRKRGVFEEASGGTLFLDEIGELPFEQQAKLLRVLETREIRRVGGEGVVRIDVRVVCATHRNLAARAAEGKFRTDLFFRLAILRIQIPALRERLEDLPTLAKHLMARISVQSGRTKRLDDAAIARLMQHHWPGNVRELYGVLCRAASEDGGERVGVEHMAIDAPVGVPAQPHQTQSSSAKHDVRGAELKALYAECEHNLSRLARATGLARSTLRERLRRADRGEGETPTP